MVGNRDCFRVNNILNHPLVINLIIWYIESSASYQYYYIVQSKWNDGWKVWGRKQENHANKRSCNYRWRIMYINFYPWSVNYSRRQAVRPIYLFVRLKRRRLGGCIHHGRFPHGVKIAQRTRRSSRRITGTGDVLSQGITRLTGSKRATSRRERVRACVCVKSASLYYLPITELSLLPPPDRSASPLS